MKNLKLSLLSGLLLAVPWSSGLFALRVPFPDVQVGTWVVWHYAVKPQPRATSPGSKVRMGGTGFGFDATVRYFLPFYYGVQYEYMPVYSESGGVTLDGYGNVAYGANLYAHYFAGAIYFPLGDWVYELFFESDTKPMPALWQSLLRSPYVKASYGLHHMYVTLTTNGEDSTSHAARFGYTGEAGLMFMVLRNLRVYGAFDYHSVYEDDYALVGLKTGMVYRYSFEAARLPDKDK